MQTYEEAERVIIMNIRATVVRLLSEGITGMSIDNLRQVTPTTGVVRPLTPAGYSNMFEETVKKLTFRHGFKILD